MKKCQRCTKAAVLHITELLEGESKALHLCESCAQDYLTSVPVGAAEDDLEDDDLVDDSAIAEDFDDDTGSCTSCGITFREFRKQGRLGCPHCYAVFTTELQPLLENIHGDSEHVGKCPRRAPDSSVRQYELIRLRKELQSAIDSEQYETAAELRDKIAEFEDSSIQDDD